jgi:hypothetical protein
MKLQHKILVWTWLLALLTTTIGVSVHAIYCYCTHQTTFSLFEKSDNCDTFEKKLDCCQKTVKSCCAKDDAAYQKKSCKKKTTKIFQLKTEFLAHSIQLQEFDFQAIVPVALFFEYTNVLPKIGIANLYFNKGSPPIPISGKNIRYLICSLRC